MDVYCWAYHINPSIPVIMFGVPRFSNVGRRRQRTSEPAHVCVFQWDLYCMSYEANIFDHGWKGTDSLNSTIMCLTCLQTSYLSIYQSIKQSINQSINRQSVKKTWHLAKRVQSTRIPDKLDPVVFPTKWFKWKLQVVECWNTTAPECFRYVHLYSEWIVSTCKILQALRGCGSCC